MWRSLRFVLAIALTAFLSSVATAYYYRTTGFEAIFPELEGLDITKISHVVQTVRKSFVNEVSTEMINDGILKGIVANLGDPYSQYLDEEGFRRLNEDASGSFTGIGVHVGIRDGYVTVIAPIKGTPADDAGLKAGDHILFVDGKDLTQGSLEEAVQLIRGEEGTPVNLQVIRDGSIMSFTIIRANVKVASVEWEMVGNDIGYLRITSFSEDTFESVSKALEDLDTRGATGLILDLRANPGGLLEEVMKIGDMFLPEGPFFEVVARDGSREKYTSSSQGYPHPIVVLIDGGSASASEILAGAIADRGVGVLVGTRTFGKGLVQSVLDLRDGTGLKITTARYYTPSGKVINGNGIEPHITVELVDGETAVSPSGGPDSQVKKALEVLRQGMQATAA